MLILEIPHVFLRSTFFSALDLNKFPKNVKIECNDLKRKTDKYHFPMNIQTGFHRENRSE